MHIVVNKHIVRANLNKVPEEREPPFRCSHSKTGKPFYLSGPIALTGKLIYDPEHPMPCGATVWFETQE